eukprot:sb/3472232/
MTCSFIKHVNGVFSGNVWRAMSMCESRFRYRVPLAGTANVTIISFIFHFTGQGNSALCWNIMQLILLSTPHTYNAAVGRVIAMVIQKETWELGERYGKKERDRLKIPKFVIGRIVPRIVPVQTQFYLYPLHMASSSQSYSLQVPSHKMLRGIRTPVLLRRKVNHKLKPL